jgi:hypothetical protein
MSAVLPTRPRWIHHRAIPAQHTCSRTNDHVVIAASGAWNKARIDPGYTVDAVSCPSVSLCVAGDSNGSIFTSTHPTSGTNSWTRATVDVSGCARPSTPCISEQLFARDDRSTRVVDAALPGQGKSIGKVALSGDSLMLSWTHDGAQRQLELR